MATLYASYCNSGDNWDSGAYENESEADERAQDHASQTGHNDFTKKEFQ